MRLLATIVIVLAVGFLGVMGYYWLRDGSLQLARRIGFALRIFADFLHPRVRYYVWSWRDPKPMLADLAGIRMRRMDSA